MICECIRRRRIKRPFAQRLIPLVPTGVRLKPAKLPSQLPGRTGQSELDLHRQS